MFACGDFANVAPVSAVPYTRLPIFAVQLFQGLHIGQATNVCGVQWEEELQTWKELAPTCADVFVLELAGAVTLCG